MIFMMQRVLKFMIKLFLNDSYVLENIGSLGLFSISPWTKLAQAVMIRINIPEVSRWNVACDTTYSD
jgi:hypothetical protein